MIRLVNAGFRLLWIEHVGLDEEIVAGDHSKFSFFFLIIEQIKGVPRVRVQFFILSYVSEFLSNFCACKLFEVFEF